MHIILHFVTSNDWYQNRWFFYGTSYKPRRSGACSLSFSLTETNGRPTPAIDYNDWYHFWYQFSHAWAYRRDEVSRARPDAPPQAACP